MLFFDKKIKLHLYLDGMYVGKVRIKPNENPRKNVYIVHCWFKKQIFKSNHVRIMVHPTNFLYEKKNELHYTFEFEEGVNVNDR